MNETVSDEVQFVYKESILGRCLTVRYLEHLSYHGVSYQKLFLSFKIIVSCE